MYRCFLLLLLASSTTASAQSLWDHNDSIVELKASGTNRQFLYSKPRTGLSVTAGTVLFTGTKSGDTYSGTAYSFLRNCPPLGYEVSGPVATDQRTVTMHGKLPKRDRSCKVTGYSDDTLVFRFRDATASQPSGLVSPSVAAPVVSPVVPDGASSCGPAAARIEQVSFTISRRVRTAQPSCATRESPANFKIGIGAPALGIVIRPTNGDIDVFLVQEGNVIDASLNKNRLSELVILPPGAKQLELTVAAVTPLAHFEVALLDIKMQPAATEHNHWVAFALRVLGYDLAGPLDASESRTDNVDQRSIMAFQAMESVPVTGRLAGDQERRLLARAANRVDGAARASAERALDVSRRALARDFSPIAGSPTDDASQQDANPTGLKNIQGRLSAGKFLGVGQLNSGQIFAGEWLDSPDSDSQRPNLGVIQLSKDCMATIRTYRLGSNYNLPRIFESAIGVVRFRNRPVFAGQLAAADLTEEARACLSPGGDVAGQ